MILLLSSSVLCSNSFCANSDAELGAQAVIRAAKAEQKVEDLQGTVTAQAWELWFWRIVTIIAASAAASNASK